jgi:hypothetical protein
MNDQSSIDRLEPFLGEWTSFSQRLQAEFSEDLSSITGAWQASDDGVNWRHDFDLTYRRVG